jgi:hypothetical protein
MRTSVLGIPHFADIDKVIENTTTISKVRIYLNKIHFLYYLLFFIPYWKERETEEWIHYSCPALYV